MYINVEQRKKVEESGSAITSFEDLTYAVSVFILRMWNDAPNDNTLGILTRELIIDQKNSKFIQNLRSLLAHGMPVADIHTACRLAYDEFNNRVIRLYRAAQCRKNGDLEGYTQAITPLLMELGSEIQKEKASQIIIPSGAK